MQNKRGRGLKLSEQQYMSEMLRISNLYHSHNNCQTTPVMAGTELSGISRVNNEFENMIRQAAGNLKWLNEIICRGFKQKNRRSCAVK